MSKARLVLKDVMRHPVVRSIPVQWGEMDAFQHVNNTVYFKYFEVARLAYFEKLVETIQGLDTSNEFDAEGFLTGRGLGPILSSTECSFKFPLRYPDTALVAATVKPEDVRESSYDMSYIVWSSDHERPAAVGSGTVTSFDYNSGKVAPLPQVVTQAIEDLYTSSLE